MVTALVVVESPEGVWTGDVLHSRSHSARERVGVAVAAAGTMVVVTAGGGQGGEEVTFVAAMSVASLLANCAFSISGDAASEDDAGAYCGGATVVEGVAALVDGPDLERKARSVACLALLNSSSVNAPSLKSSWSCAISLARDGADIAAGKSLVSLFFLLSFFGVMQYKDPSSGSTWVCICDYL